MLIWVGSDFLYESPLNSVLSILVGDSIGFKTLAWNILELLFKSSLEESIDIDP